MRLPPIVNLNSRFQRAHQWQPTESDLKLEQRDLLSTSLLHASPVPCNSSMGVFSGFNFCGFAASAGGRLQAFSPVPATGIDVMRHHSKQLPLTNLLAFVEGNLTAADRLVRAGVDFASVAILNFPTCQLVFTPKSTFPLYGSPASFQRGWEALAMHMDQLPEVKSRDRGYALTSEHRQSLARAAAAVTERFREIPPAACRLHVQFVTTACRGVKVHAIYGSSGGISSDRKLTIDEVDNANAGSPGEYFAALTSCSL